MAHLHPQNRVVSLHITNLNDFDDLAHRDKLCLYFVLSNPTRDQLNTAYATVGAMQEGVGNNDYGLVLKLDNDKLVLANYPALLEGETNVYYKSPKQAVCAVGSYNGEEQAIADVNEVPWDDFTTHGLSRFMEVCSTVAINLLYVDPSVYCWAYRDEYGNLVWQEISGSQGA